MNQPTSAPTTKVKAGGAVGVVATIIAWSLGQAGVDMPAEVAVAFASAVIFLAGYFAPEKG